MSILLQYFQLNPAGIFNKLRAFRRRQRSCCFYKPLTTVITRRSTPLLIHTIAPLVRLYPYPGASFLQILFASPRHPLSFLRTHTRTYTPQRTAVLFTTYGRSIRTRRRVLVPIKSIPTRVNPPIDFTPVLTFNRLGFSFRLTNTGEKPGT